jgi:hypothetical protein
MDLRRAMAMELPPLQSVLELTSAARPPERASEVRALGALRQFSPSFVMRSFSRSSHVVAIRFRIMVSPITSEREGALYRKLEGKG